MPEKKRKCKERKNNVEISYVFFLCLTFSTWQLLIVSLVIVNIPICNPELFLIH